jgi:hypothetical protein
LVPPDILGPKPAMVDLLLMMMKMNVLEMTKAMKMIKARTGTLVMNNRLQMNLSMNPTLAMKTRHQDIYDSKLTS